MTSLVAGATTYRSEPVEVQVMHWIKGRGHLINALTELQRARAIVQWVNDNGGYAHYEPNHPWDEWGSACVCNGGDAMKLSYVHPARIAIRRPRGWAFAHVGYYVVMGKRQFDFVSVDYPEYPEPHKMIDFYPVTDLAQIRVDHEWKDVTI